MKVAVYDPKGIKKEDIEVKSPIFDSALNPVLLHEVLTIQMGNRRQDNAKTKTRAEVAGGGKKPWKQKGTGRARSGSVRNPIWRGGGITFGPTGEQNHHRQIPKKKKRAALVSAFSAKKDSVVILEGINVTKTKDFAKIAKAITGDRRGLFIFEKIEDKELKPSNNLKKINVTDYRNLNVYDVMVADKIVFVGKTLANLDVFLEAK